MGYLEAMGFTEEFFKSVDISAWRNESACAVVIADRIREPLSELLQGKEICFHRFNEITILSLRIEGTKIKLEEVDNENFFFKILRFGSEKDEVATLQKRIEDLEGKRKVLITNSQDCEIFIEKEKSFSNYFDKVIMNRNGLYENNEQKICVSVFITENDKVYGRGRIYVSQKCDQTLRNIFARFIPSIDDCWWKFLEQHKYYEDILKLHFWTNISNARRLREKRNFIDALIDVEEKADDKCRSNLIRK